MEIDNKNSEEKEAKQPAEIPEKEKDHVNLYQFLCYNTDYIYFYPEVIPYERIPVISQKLYVPSSFKGYF